MLISEIHILPTDNTPEFLLNPEGIIKIKGRGLIINKTEVLEQIMNWIDEYISNPADTTDVIIAFEYLNSFSTVILVSILRKLLQFNRQTKKLTIHWYFEDGDDDILERGEYISSAYNIPIEFIMVDDITVF
jgi:hypothetical protein